ncbi:hypothetical protein [Micromonospora sp. NPDC050200]|uniref:hypothetical protein n=1 Tax=Micromonospora sp. NPDC050200 TaxID=3155664 RepID=UPI0033C0EA71
MFARATVTRATARARARRRTLTSEGPDALIRAGEDAVRTTFARYADAQVLTDDELAWLTLLLPILIEVTATNREDAIETAEAAVETALTGAELEVRIE